MNKSNEPKNVHSISLTDKNYELLKEKAEAAHLSLSDYIVTKELEECETIPPDILCRLESLHNILKIPREAINDSLERKYKEDLKEICARLLW